MDTLHQGDDMSQKPNGRSRRVLGMTRRQLGVLVILAILLLLVVLAALALALGVLNRSKIPILQTGHPTRTPSEVEFTQPPDTPAHQTSLPTSSTLAEGTETPTVKSMVHTSTPATQTTTPTHTLTPLADICALLDLRFISSTSNITAWRLQNDSGTALMITRIEIDWPKSNDAIFNAFLDGKVIWSNTDLTPPTIMTTWIGDPGDRRVDRLSRVEFFFGTMAAPGGYDLYLWFDNGCEVSAAN